MLASRTPGGDSVSTTQQVYQRLTRASALIEAKFRAPPIAVRLLQRERLLCEIERHASARLVLIRAPAGYGKSVLLAQWQQRLNERQRPTGWLSVDRGDQAPGAVFPYLVHALQQAGFDFDPAAVQAAHEQIDVDAVAAARTLVAAMHTAAPQACLLIDGVDDLAASAGTAMIEALLLYADKLQIVATAQRRPPLPLARLRAAGLLMEIGSHDLRFSLTEIESLFDALVPAGYLRGLRARTDGVAVALSFARAAIEQPPAVLPWTESLDDFYREQIFDSLPRDLRLVVSRLVIVERFDASLARAIVGRDIGAELERLHREENLLIVDSRTGLFQFPVMFHASLRAQLQWMSDDERRELHRRAENWFAARGFLHEALLHAMAADDAAGTSQLFRKIGGSSMVLRFGVPVLRAAMEQMQSVVSDEGALVQWSQVLLLTQQGLTEEASALAGRIGTQQEGGLSSATDPETGLVKRESLVAGTLLAAYSDRRLPLDRELALGRAAEQLTTEDHLYQGFISNLLCWMRYERAEFSAADGDAEHAISEFTADGGLYGSLFMHLHRIIIRFWQNRLDEALAEARLVSRLQRLFFPADGRLQWLCRVFESWLLCDLGQVGAAAILLQNSLDGLDANEGWFEAQLLAHVTSARIAAARGETNTVASILIRGQRLAAARDLPRLGWHLDFHRIAFSMSKGIELDLPPELRFCPDARDDPDYFTWRERFQAGVLGVRLAIRNAQLERARQIIEQLDAELLRIEVPRARTTLLLLRASAAHAAGDVAAHDQFVEHAASAFDGSCSIQLFEEEGIALPRHREAQAMPVTAIAAIGSDADTLTQREREIMALLASGRPNKVIAHQIGLSEATVKFHLRNIYRKLKAHNRVQAVAYHRAGDSR